MANLVPATFNKVTGDVSRANDTWNTVALEINLPVVLDVTGKLGTNTLKKKDHPINSEYLSGKKYGSFCILAKPDGSEMVLALSTGTGNTKDWLIFEPSATKVTPA